MILPKDQIVPAIKKEVRAILGSEFGTGWEGDADSFDEDVFFYHGQRKALIKNLRDFRAGRAPDHSHGDLVADNSATFAWLIEFRRACADGSYFI